MPSARLRRGAFLKLILKQEIPMSAYLLREESIREDSENKQNAESLGFNDSIRAYFSNIRKCPLLTAEEERDLSSPFSA